MRTERKTSSGLVIVGDKPDVELYMSLRGVVSGFDPATGQRVVYGGKKKMSMPTFGQQKYGFGDSWETNPYIRYGDEFRMSRGAISKLWTPDGDNQKAYDPEGKLEITGMANANIIDRVDERLDPAGVDVENYSKNNIFLLDHMYMSDYAVGLVERLEPTDAGVEFDAMIGDPSKGPLTERQKNARSLIAQSILKTVSVGFIPHKIRAPEFDGDGHIVEPAVILVWEMLELSGVAIPCNAGSTFQQRQMAKQQRKNLMVRGVSFNQTTDHELTNPNPPSQNENNQIGDVKNMDDGAAVQSVIFDLKIHDAKAAMEWLDGHEFKNIGNTENAYNVRVAGDFVDGSFKTLEIDQGIQVVVGQLKEDITDMDKETAEALLNGIKELVTKTGEMSGHVKQNIEATEKLLAASKKSNRKKGDDEDDDEDDDDDDEKSLSKRVKELEKSVGTINDSLKSIDDVLGKIAEQMNGDNAE